MTPARLHALAEKIARSLFTNGSQERAQRLVLTIDKPTHRDLGGLRESVVVDRILAALQQIAVEQRDADALKVERLLANECDARDRRREVSDLQSALYHDWRSQGLALGLAALRDPQEPT